MQRVEERTTVQNHEIVEEIDRPHYQKLHTSPGYRYDRVAAENAKRNPKKSCCSPCCWALWGLLGLAGVVLGMLFGLGVIGGLNKPDLGIHLPSLNAGGGVHINGGGDAKINGGVGDNEVVIDGATYPKSSITVEKTVLKKTPTSTVPPKE